MKFLIASILCVAFIACVAEPPPDCLENYYYSGSDYIGIFYPNKNVKQECQSKCQEHTDCSTWEVCDDVECYLYTEDALQKDGVTKNEDSDCVIGPQYCQETTEEPTTPTEASTDCSENYYYQESTGGALEPIGGEGYTANTAKECQVKCQEVTDCFIWDFGDFYCYLYTKDTVQEDGVTKHKTDDYVTGPQYCPDVICNCPSGFVRIQNGCYHFSSIRLNTPSEAASSCTTLSSSSSLLTLETEEEWEDMKSYMNSNDVGKRSYWIGLKKTSGEWAWPDGSALTFTPPWYRGGPYGAADCVILMDMVTKRWDQLYNWRKFSCTPQDRSYKQYYICEIACEIETTEAPTEEPTEAPTEEPTEAPTEEPTTPTDCSENYYYTGSDSIGDFFIDTAQECQLKCQEHTDCFTWEFCEGSCYMYTEDALQKDGVTKHADDGCVIGPQYCPETTEEPTTPTPTEAPTDCSENYYYSGYTVVLAYYAVDTPKECQVKCQEHTDCFTWDFSPFFGGSYICNLFTEGAMNDDVKKIESDDSVIGPQYCPETTEEPTTPTPTEAPTGESTKELGEVCEPEGNQCKDERAECRDTQSTTKNGEPLYKCWCIDRYANKDKECVALTTLELGESCMKHNKEKEHPCKAANSVCMGGNNPKCTCLKPFKRIGNECKSKSG